MPNIDLRKEIKRRGLTQHQIAQTLGRSQTWVWKRLQYPGEGDVDLIMTAILETEKAVYG